MFQPNMMRTAMLVTVLVLLIFFLYPAAIVRLIVASGELNPFRNLTLPSQHHRQYAESGRFRSSGNLKGVNAQNANNVTATEAIVGFTSTTVVRSGSSITSSIASSTYFPSAPATSSSIVPSTASREETTRNAIVVGGRLFVSHNLAPVEVLPTPSAPAGLLSRRIHARHARAHRWPEMPAV